MKTAIQVGTAALAVFLLTVGDASARGGGADEGRLSRVVVGAEEAPVVVAA